MGRPMNHTGLYKIVHSACSLRGFSMPLLLHQLSHFKKNLWSGRPKSCWTKKMVPLWPLGVVDLIRFVFSLVWHDAIIQQMSMHLEFWFVQHIVGLCLVMVNQVTLVTALSVGKISFTTSIKTTIKPFAQLLIYFIHPRARRSILTLQRNWTFIHRMWNQVEWAQDLSF